MLTINVISLSGKSISSTLGTEEKNLSHSSPTRSILYCFCFRFCFFLLYELLALVFMFISEFNHILLIYLFIFGCVGSSFLCEGFLQFQRAVSTLHRGARVSHCRGLSCCGAQAPDAQAQ